MKKLLPVILVPFAFTLAHAAPATPEPAATLHFRNEDVPVFAAPQLVTPLQAALPEYPQSQQREGAGGQVVLNILVDTDGSVAAVEVASSIPSASFGVAARAAALNWKYAPRELNGRPTKFVVQQGLIFDAGVEPRGDVMWVGQNAARDRQPARIIPPLSRPEKPPGT